MSLAADLSPITLGAERLIARKRRLSFALPGLVLLYLVYAFFAFDVPGLIGRARLDNAQVLLQDFWSHKIHVTQSNNSGDVRATIEGSRRNTLGDDQWPDWIAREGAATVIDLPGGNVVTLMQGQTQVQVQDYGTVVIRPGDQGIVLDLPSAQIPDWISASEARVDIRMGWGRVVVTKANTDVQRRVPGWELFFFDLRSAYWGKSFGQLAGMALSDPAHIGGMAHDFWNNNLWHHKDVAGALFETLLMAFLGTIGGALIALPLSFLSARNFAPNHAIRHLFRRLFDFLRGVDGLIWTIILARAFGPGPLTGSLAILLTDTGTFGKLYSEALENVDAKQIEGLRSTGAGALQRNRWGVIPQVAPVMLSQVLYLLESNTRSATVIGALVGGGIGLLLTQAIATQQNWEQVTYYIILIVLLVIAMDSASGWLRRRIARG